VATILTAFAIVAHPDDIEFMMAGTLLLLKDSGADIHMWNLSTGCYGSVTHPAHEIAHIRWQEAQDSAREAGATMHPPIVDDLAIVYDLKLLARISAVIREVKPDIVLTQSPQDYMEDHMNTSRLVLTAAFARGMPNYITDPSVEAYSGDTTVYHALPHGLRDGLRRRIRAGQYVDITSVLPRKRNMLARHRSQKEWLDVSQGMDSYLLEMEKMSREVGQMSGRFEVAEGWRRHLHLGFSARDIDPLHDALADKSWIDPAYEEQTL
jgi:LmbE family N-acetylglucosaminyl deacetylase